MGVEKQEACQLFIEQEIDRALDEGKSPYRIGKEVAEWLQGLFEVKVKQKSIADKANYIKKKRIGEKFTSAPTPSNQTESPGNQTNQTPAKDGTQRGGPRPGAGRPPKILHDGDSLVVTPEPNRTQFSGDNEWFTPPKYIDLARTCMGSIDLDPASSDAAQKRVNAYKHFTVEQDGLALDWGGNVWLNPPYAQPAIFDFAKKAVQEYLAGHIKQMIILTHNYTDTAWFHHLEAAATRLCFTRGRIAFEKSDGQKAAPTQGQCFFYCGGKPERFSEVFSAIGFIR